MTIKGVFLCIGIAPNPNGTLLATFRPEWDAPQPGVTTEDICFPVNGTIYEAHQVYAFDVRPYRPGDDIIAPVDPPSPGSPHPVAA